ncbi:hypothetical protein FRB91_010022 [Serendipita sp. 411]|nr:hypothetical protein FRC18_010360 [Serendipita sp. 400]KAG8849365.1 hypothetical protein FRB91_010022 [Serendipita sp. 411]
MVSQTKTEVRSSTLRVYQPVGQAASSVDKFVASRVITHNGTVVAFALRMDPDPRFFYAVLDLNDNKAPPSGAKRRGAGSSSEAIKDPHDVYAWPDAPTEIIFPSEARLVGADAVPPFTIPAYDTRGRKLKTRPQTSDGLDMIKSTTAGLTDPDAIEFEVLSSGKYIYLFRQSRKGDDPDTPRVQAQLPGMPPSNDSPSVPIVNSNLLVDRFILAGNTLSCMLEVRYRRSGHKGLPLNNKDTLGVRDMNNIPFNEPTLILSFISHMYQGRFTVLQTPTMINGQFKWTIFNFSTLTNQYEYFVTDVSKDGLFDTRGRVYYSCESAEVDHESVFKTEGGKCTAINNEGIVCGKMLHPIVTSSSRIDTALSFEAPEHDIFLELLQPIALSGDKFKSGFTLEAWIAPSPNVPYDVEGRPRRLYEAANRRKLHAQAHQLTNFLVGRESREEKIKALGSEPNVEKLQKIKERYAWVYEMEAGLQDYMRAALEKGMAGDEIWGLLLDKKISDDVGPHDGEEPGLRAQKGSIDEKGGPPSDTGTSKDPEALYCIFGSADPTDPSVYIDFNYRILIRSSDSNGNHVDLAASQEPIKQSTWSHLAISYDPKIQKYAIFINGRAVTQQGRGVGVAGSLGFLGRAVSEEMPTFYRGQMDELRLWSLPLDAGTIAERMHFRSPGYEENLQGLWRFNEASGAVCFDTSGYSGPFIMDKQLRAPPLRNNELPPKDPSMWTKSTAPIIGGTGIIRSTLRLDQQSFLVAGGISAAVAYEQVLVSDETTPPDDADQSMEKPLKRTGRLLVSFVVCLSQVESTPPNGLVVFDFPLSDIGVVEELPGIIFLPTPEQTPAPGSTVQESSDGVAKLDGMHLLLTDGRGLQLFGSLVSFDQVHPSGKPLVWASADGNVLIYYKNQDNYFMALAYDTTRTKTSSPISTIPSQNGASSSLLCTPKGRATSSVMMDVSPCPLGPFGLDIIDVDIIAGNGDGQQIVETWTGVPSAVDRFVSVLDGSDMVPDVLLGPLAEITKLDGDVADNTASSSNPVAQFHPVFRIKLVDELPVTILPATSIIVGGYRFWVLETAPPGQKFINVGPPYASGNSGHFPQQNDEVILRQYDYEGLVECPDRDHANFKHGSTLVNVSAQKLGGISTVDNIAIVRLNAPSTVPHFSTSYHSRAWQNTYPGQFLSLADPDTARNRMSIGGRGLTLEFWFTLHQLVGSNSILYYRDENVLLEGVQHDQAITCPQVASVEFKTIDNRAYHLQGCINKKNFVLENSLDADSWNHFAALFTQGFGIVFNKQTMVDFGHSTDLSLDGNFTVELSFSLSDLSHDMVILTQGSGRCGKGSKVPFELAYQADKSHLIVSWNDEESGQVIIIHLDAYQIQASIPYHLAITRLLESSDPDQPEPSLRQRVLYHLIGDDGNGISASGQSPTGRATSSDAPLRLGGVPDGFQGTVSQLRISKDRITSWIEPFKNLPSSFAGWWRFREGSGRLVEDIAGTNDGKIQGLFSWTTSPHSADSDLQLYINGTPVAYDSRPELLRGAKFGPAEMLLGPGNRSIGLLELPKQAEDGNYLSLDELRIWSTPRHIEEITDSLYGRLANTERQLAIYYSIDNLRLIGEHDCIPDESGSGWHLAVTDSLSHLVVKRAPNLIESTSPVSFDAPLVFPAIGGPTRQRGEALLLSYKGSAVLQATPSVTEYGEMQIASDGVVGGAYKRCYSTITHGQWHLTTGFKIGNLVSEWIAQVQTDPTLIGYVEGAPPIPKENYWSGTDEPFSSVRFVDAEKTTYTYNARGEDGTSRTINTDTSLGGEWEIYGGLGVESLLSRGHIKAHSKTNLEISNSAINNAMVSKTNVLNKEIRVDSTGRWVNKDDSNSFEFNNTGIAVVESETADIFALRLKLKDRLPLVAYSLSPNPDIPKDINLLSFKINSFYTKQGTLDGRVGSEMDPDYPERKAYTSESSYFRPKEAYALRSRIRREQEQLQGEYENFQLNYARYMKQIGGAANSLSTSELLERLPPRSNRNICNSYVWTAAGGTYLEGLTTIDYRQTEVGGNFSSRNMIGLCADYSASAAGFASGCEMDVMSGLHFTMSATKENSSESSFELLVEPCRPIDVQELSKSGQLQPRPGMVDAYRWMSFFLEPSTENTDMFFNQVVDPEWLEDPTNPSALALKELQRRLSKLDDKAREKTWRIFHRVTFVSRVLDKIPQGGAGVDQGAHMEKKIAEMDLSSNWLLMQQLGPYVRMAKDKVELADLARAALRTTYPILESDASSRDAIIAFLATYLGVPDRTTPL